MKKTVVLAFAVLMTAGACASSGAATISTPLSAAEPVQNAVEAPSAGHPFAQETKDDIIPPEGTYVSTNESFSGKYRPSVTFNKDGTFAMEENLYEGMGTYSGQYSYDGYYYECGVSEISFSGFAGDDVKKIGFARFDGNTIILQDDLCGSLSKDVFVREEQLKDNSGSEDYTIKPKQEVGEVNETRLYSSSSKMFSDPYVPTLQLNPDGTFELTENLFEGMGHYKGTYATADEYRLTLTVTDTDFKGFSGDSVKTIEFEALSKDVLELRTDLCGSLTGDIFYLNP